MKRHGKLEMPQGSYYLVEDFDKWTPTADNINALPDPIKRYIHDLETNCDPQYIIRENILTKGENNALLAQIEELRDALNQSVKIISDRDIKIKALNGECDSCNIRKGLEAELERVRGCLDKATNIASEALSYISYKCDGKTKLVYDLNAIRKSLEAQHGNKGERGKDETLREQMEEYGPEVGTDR